MKERSDDTTRLARLERIVAGALARTGPDRARFLDEACGDDATLRAEAERLLDEGSGDSLDEGAAGLLRTVDLADAGDGARDAWDAFLEQLRSRGTNWTRYVDEGEVARGGMGAIRRVYDQDVRRPLALKLMLGEADRPDDGSLGRFLEEAQVTGQLDHPGIVPVHEVGVDAEGRVYFTMKLVKGEDLRAVFDRVADPNDEEWTQTRALNVMLRVCEAMAYAHAKGVIHRDLKPGNVMVGRYGEAYVMDWGLAKVLGREDRHDLRLRPDTTESLKTERRDAAEETPDSPILTMDGAVVGTPAYMPPEQALGKVDALGPPADVYAVGAMLYHLLARRMPYTEPGARMSARTILTMVIQGPPRPLADLGPDAPAELVAIVEKAMAREVGDRYPDMTALARDLRAFVEHRVVAAYETGAWAELKKWVWRNRTLATTTAAALLVIVALTAWFVTNVRAKEREAVAERDRVLRLSDKRRLDVLLAETDALWPARPEMESDFKAWLARARGLLAKLPLHEATLAEVRARGTPLPHPRDGELAELEAHLAEHEAGGEVAGESFDDAATRTDHTEGLEAAITSLEATIARERDHDFDDDADARWWHDAVRDLVVGLNSLRSEDVDGPTVAGIEERLTWAETIEERTTTGPEVARLWAEAREAVRANPRYGGLDLAPQVGLVPLGADPESGMWEFGHLRTGGIPIRNEETGRLEITDDTGLVFVLLPGGEYLVERDGLHFRDGRMQAELVGVTLSPYFLSKYEMTQGQWERVTGHNPSVEKPTKWYPFTASQHPVENVSWSMCRDTLRELGLELPTASQWEAAFRAETPWNLWEPEGILDRVERAAAREGRSTRRLREEWSKQGYRPHAPVGRSPWANGLGLYEMESNVSEWCRDGYPSREAEVDVRRTGDGLRVTTSNTVRVHCGASYPFDGPSRSLAPADNREPSIGLRPAKPLDP